MNITRDVVKDLLPLYVAGEASADSRAAVESVLATDRELSALAASMREDAPVVQQPSSVGSMAPDRRTLERTRHLLRQRTGFLVGAIFFTLLPFSVIADANGLRFVFSAVPVLQWSFLSAALVFWICYAVIRHKMRVTGL